MEYRELKESYYAEKQTYWHDNMVDYINWLEDKIIDSQTNWISVEDRLPEYYSLVLCYGNNSFAVCWMASDGDHDIYTIAGSDNIMRNVTHWQPLPTPPKH